MLESLPEGFKPHKNLVEEVKELDKHYIPSRYLNFHPEGAPLDYYTRADAERAVRYAGKVVEFARSKVVQA
ncbi:MAG: HEPN domain-containing protein [Candidatus Bathyarchaeota archaeon]